MSQNAAQQIHEHLNVPSKVGGGDNWDEVRDKLEARCIRTLAESSNLVNEMAQTAIAAGVADEELQIQAKGTMNDLLHYRDRFKSLERQRDGRTGPTKDDKDFTDYMRIGMEHLTLQQEMSTVLGPGLIALSEYYEVARSRLQAQDPKEVTDVEPREIPANPEAEQAQ